MSLQSLESKQGGKSPEKGPSLLAQNETDRQAHFLLGQVNKGFLMSERTVLSRLQCRNLLKNLKWHPLDLRAMQTICQFCLLPQVWDCGGQLEQHIARAVVYGLDLWLDGLDIDNNLVRIRISHLWKHHPVTVLHESSRSL